MRTKLPSAINLTNLRFGDVVSFDEVLRPFDAMIVEFIRGDEIRLKRFYGAVNGVTALCGSEQYIFSLKHEGHKAFYLWDNISYRENIYE